MKQHTRKKSEFFKIGDFGGKEFYIEHSDNEYFWWFGKLCCVTNKLEITDSDLNWLLRNFYSEQVREQINKKVREVFNETRR